MASARPFDPSSEAPAPRSTAPLFDDDPRAAVSTVPPPRRHAFASAPTTEVAIAPVPDVPDVPDVGDLVDERYQVTEILGQGGMGRVYAVTDLALDREVALKLSLDVASDEHIEREARALAPIRHPSLPAVHGAGRHGGRAYVVTERLAGASLRRTLHELSRRDERMAIATLVGLLESIAEGLAVLHREGLAHLDLKPSNVMLCDERVVLIDFGLTRALVAKGDARPHGTAEYVAPEVVRGELGSGSAPLVDLYALGIVAFELIVGHPPFTSDSIATTLRRHVSDEVPYVRQLRPEVPVALAELVAALVEKSPRDRPGSAEYVRLRLAEIRAHRGAR